MVQVRVNLHPLVNNINLPTVLKTARLPGDSRERLFIATQVGEIYYLKNEDIIPFLDISSQVIELGISDGGYDERGLLGLAFHPEFHYNGLFYLHYSLAGSQGPGALQTKTENQSQNGLPKFFNPNPCNPETLNLKWTNREINYDHIDTVEEWIVQSNDQPKKRRSLLNLRRPFFNHNGVDSLNFSPETGRLVLTTGDGGSGYDPFNLSQDNMEIAGKIIEIDVNKNTSTNNESIVTRFNELPVSTQELLTVIAKGGRNITGISYQRFNNRFIKYVGNVGQHLVESVFSFIQYKAIPVTRLTQNPLTENQLHEEGFINLGWRGWEGCLPTSIIQDCDDSNIDEKIIAYYNEAIKIASWRLNPLTCYFHKDHRPNKFEGTALTGVQPYMGNRIPALKGKVVFTDFARGHVHNSQSLDRGVLAYTNIRSDCNLNDYSIIEVNYDFGSSSAFYVSLGSNMNQTRLYLGVYGSMNVTDTNKGTVFEIVP